MKVISHIYLNKFVNIIDEAIVVISWVQGHASLVVVCVFESTCSIFKVRFDITANIKSDGGSTCVVCQIGAKNLTHEGKQKCLASIQKFVQCYKNEGD